jgi:hypothetical protein
MMEIHAEEQNPKLTIVNRSLLRVTNEEWVTPEAHFERIGGHALDLLLTAASSRSSGTRWSNRRALLLFDCLLRVIDEPAISSTIALNTLRFKTLQMLYYGALGSERFINSAETSRVNLAYHFYKVLNRLAEASTIQLAAHHQKAAGRVPKVLVQAFEKLELNDAEVRKLRPYLLMTKAGTEYNVLLGAMVPVLGEQFTDAFHGGLRAIARPKAKDTALRDFGTTFAQFACHRAVNHQPISPELLADPSFVQIFLVDFMEYHFMKMARRKAAVQEGTLSSLQKLWSRYAGYWEALVARKIVAPPMSAFPSGNPKLLSDHSVGHRKVKTDTDGNTTVITQKLITAVPLHITDEQATKLVFEQLKADFTSVQTWLREHLNSFFNDYETGLALAAEVHELPATAELEVATSKYAGNCGFPLAIKYFKEVHGGYTDTSQLPTPVYPHLAARGRISKVRLSRYLGIPNRQDAMAFMAYLASHDGRISESALATAKLLDSKGTRINAVETDAGLTLTVLKERDVGDGWHNVPLTGEVAALVRRWIEVTTPLRKHMKLHGVSGWQNLVIYAGNPLGATAIFTRSSNIHSTFRHFAQQYESRLGKLAEQVTIARIRSTRGVLVFLESMDLTKMARELGNSNETSLRHYLPDSLWEYFTTRWVRIFQNLLIVEATRDTPYMQRALHFSSATEMDEFLKNHAVTPLIPPEEELLETTPAAGSARTPDELMIAASPGLFATLLSISDAARQIREQGRQLAPQAVYWTEFAQRLKAHIESGAFHDRGIKQMMREAEANATPENFMEVVCA